MVTISQKGDFKKTEKFLKKAFGKNYMSVLAKYGQRGVQALSAATPKDTGHTAASWSYKITQGSGNITIEWYNSHIEKGSVNIAILLQYGHGTRNGGYVRGRDYINPAMKKVFDDMADAAWKEVTSL